MPETFSPPPDKVDPTGGTDVSQQLSAWLNNHAGRGACVFPAGAAYRAEHGVFCKGDDLDLTFEPKSKIFATDPMPETRSRSLLRLWGQRPKIHSPKLHGPWADATGSAKWNVNVEAQHGIEVGAKVDGLFIDGIITIRGVGGDFIYIGSVNGWRDGGIHADQPATNSSITGQLNCSFAMRQGISVCWADGCVISVTGGMGSIGRSAFDLEPIPNTDVRRFTLDGLGGGLSVYGYVNNLVSAKGGGDVSHVLIQGVVASKPITVTSQGPGPAWRRRDWTIRGNVGGWGYASHIPPFTLINTDKVVIADNVQTAEWGPTIPTRTTGTDERLDQWLTGAGCTEVTVAGNDFT